ncbi:1,4-alpha-glucan branching protein GlgB [Nesterenkonia muleiensis]|uniref:1,4-alpha-glucan branching protein GlgB n=1 Tax=Nesterenkonia muleiensis TaxID=2282648 RepID=UPI000E70DF41|nr:1,4-alpha-glucan branching protein GlgB [Nesterenkonia muleiensis]
MAASLTDAAAPLWHRFGAHFVDLPEGEAVRFAVWAPHAQQVSVVGDFNDWNPNASVLDPVGSTGIWTITVPGIAEGSLYKYQIISAQGHALPWKADPVAFGSEHPPRNGSVVRRIDQHLWGDDSWISRRAAAQRFDAPISIYEVHLGSWRCAEGGRPLSYPELAEQLVEYVADLGFTHIELMPITEHPFSGSWGYQPVGMYAPTIRHGTPEEFAALIDAAHQAGLGVIADWVPAHFPADEHGLSRFNGGPLYEHADPREGFHQDWNTLIYDYGRPEVADYLISNALYWLQEYHLDGLRVDAVASMLYRDYSREDGEWIPNRDGGRENYEAIRLLQEMNTRVYGEVPGAITVAEESTSFPGVSRPVDHGGLGFGYKWNIGWMNDALTYLGADPVHRKYHHHELTFPLTYAFTENFILPISHDEVVHGKGSLYGRAPGTHEEKLASVRAFLGYMWGHPGKKLLFMGQELAQRSEWDHEGTVDWDALADPGHAGIQSLVRDLNALYREYRALHVRDTSDGGFRWVVVDDADNSVFAWIRCGEDEDRPVLVAVNFTPVERSGYRLGLPAGGCWREALNTDSSHYGGQNRGNLGSFGAETSGSHGWPFSAEVVLPPLSTVIFTPDLS